MSFVSNVGSSGGANIAMKFSCSGTVGAFMNLQDSSTKSSFSAAGHIPEYILRNHDRWVEYSANNNLGLKPADIILVKGFVKTSVWSVAAYRSGLKHTRSASLTGKLGPLGEAGFEMEVSTKTGYLFDTRYGPLDRGQSHPLITPPSPTSSHKGKKRESSRSPPRSSKDEERMEMPDLQKIARASVVSGFSTLPHDQCIFLSYYKVKRRTWLPSKLIAKAEDKDLSGDDEPEAEVVANDENSRDLLLVRHNR